LARASVRRSSQARLQGGSRCSSDTARVRSRSWLCRQSGSRAKDAHVRPGWSASRKRQRRFSSATRRRRASSLRKGSFGSRTSRRRWRASTTSTPATWRRTCRRRSRPTISPNTRRIGSSVVVPETGVLLNNRAAYFKPQEYGPKKRPTHTLAPAMALQDGRPKFIFGTMGGDTQIEIHLQLLARVIIARQELGEAIAAPRWMHRGGSLVAEPGLPEIGAEALPAEFPELAGHAHAILVEDGHLAAAFDRRSDGAAVGYWK